MSATTPSQKVPLNRREFLTLGRLASLGFILVDIGGVSYLIAMPIFREGQFGGSFSLGLASEDLQLVVDTSHLIRGKSKGDRY